MADALTLVGFKHSVYTRIVRIALIELGMTAAYVEADPFAPDPVLGTYTPLGRVPVLQHGDFTLTETAAILRYLVRISDLNTLLPTTPRAMARMDQVIGIVDAYAYVPWVRQVFSNGFYAPLMNEPGDPGQVTTGLGAGAPALHALDAIAREGLVLDRRALSLADVHLAPMIDYLVRVDAGATALQNHPALSAWWAARAQWPALRATDPFATIPGAG